MTIDLAYVGEIFPILARAALVNVLAACVAFSLALVGGLFLALARLSTVRVLRLLATGIIEFVRDTPFLIQLFFIFYVLPRYGITFGPLETGIVALGLHWSAYTSEVYRAGIASVPSGQWDAATALNLPASRTWGRIILPQAILPVLPTLGNYLIVMFKDTAILSTIAVSELLGVALGQASLSFRYVETLTLVAILFLAMSLGASAVFRTVEGIMRPRELTRN